MNKRQKKGFGKIFDCIKDNVFSSGFSAVKIHLFNKRKWIIKPFTLGFMIFCFKAHLICFDLEAKCFILLLDFLILIVESI